MNPSFVLFDLLSGNVITDFASESDAWDSLCRDASEAGLESIENLSLLRIQDGHPTLVAMEDELVRRVAHEMSQVASKR